MSSNTIELYVWVLGSPLDQISLVTIDKTQTIIHLRAAIKLEKENGLRDYDADTLALWKFPVTKAEVPIRLENTTLDTLPDRDKLRSLHGISQVFPDLPEDGRFYLVIVQPGASSISPSSSKESKLAGASLLSGSTPPSTEARKRSPESHSGNEERKKRQKELQWVARDLETQLHECIRELPEDPLHYSDPSNAVSLPFPSINVVPPRFAVSDSGSFSYIGREKFADVWATWIDINAHKRHRQAIYVYGTKGYGKSHILAALTCLLIRKNERVVYLPDCRAMLQGPVVYLRNALLFAFTGPSSSDYRERIHGCESVEALVDFCEKYESGRLCFIIDQMNALDPEPKGEDDVPDEAKSSLGSLLRRMSFRHVYITSASANHKSAKHMATKDTGDRKIPLLGGMTTTEMSRWWLRFTSDFTAYSETDKQRVEDLTGCIPLLLEPFLGNPGKSLESSEPKIWDNDVLSSVVAAAFDFGVEKTKDKLFKSTYVPLMRACLTRSYVSGTAPMLDNRYFYLDLESGYGRYTCGLARQGIIEFLRTYGEEGIFLGGEWNLALIAFKNNPSVIGFTVEQMIISRIASSGLRCAISIPAARTKTFPGHITALSKDRPSTYYVPLKFNLKAIDALYAEVDEKNKTAKVVAIQITVAKRHRDSPAEFFANWDAWTSLLNGFDITPIFLWIVEDERGSVEVEQKLSKLRTRPIEFWPKHATHWASIDQVDKNLANTLAKIRPRSEDGVY